MSKQSVWNSAVKHHLLKMAHTQVWDNRNIRGHEQGRGTISQGPIPGQKIQATKDCWEMEK